MIWLHGSRACNSANDPVRGSDLWQVATSLSEPFHIPELS